MSNTFSVFEDWKKGLLGFVDRNQSQSDGFEDYLPNNEGSGTLDTAGGVKSNAINATMNRTSESPLIKKPIFNTQMFPPGQGQAKIGGKTINLPQSVLTDKAKVAQNNAIKQAQVNNSSKVPMGMPSDPIVTGGSGVKQAEDIGFMQKLSNMAGVDFSKASENWKDKGGFEGLMANPAFTLGLALMQSSANGKTINQGILDNFITSAKISSEFKDRIKAKGSIIGPASEAEIGQVEAFLKSKKIGGSGFVDKMKDFFYGETNAADYKMLLSDVAQYNNKRAAALEAKGKKVVKDERFMEATINEMKSKGLLKKKQDGRTKGFFANFDFLRPKIETKDAGSVGIKGLARGGPVEQGKPYVVGEEGPEIIIPTSDGNVLSNDDSQIFNMLLASNPQLQKVSRQRAEKIMRNRFPEYFEG